MNRPGSARTGTPSALRAASTHRSAPLSPLEPDESIPLVDRLPNPAPRPNSPLRIATVAPPWYEVPPVGYGGIEAICGALVDALVLRGHEITLIGAGRSGTAAGRFISTGPPQYERLGESLPELLHAAAVSQVLASDEFDVIHDHTAAGPLTATQRSAPTVVTVHNPVTGDVGTYFQRLGNSVRLVAISNSQRQLRPELAWAGMVYNSVQAERFPFRSQKSGPVLWLGRFSAEKGPDLAIAACRAAGLPLILAGKRTEPGERKYFEETIRPLLGPDIDLYLDPDRTQTVELLANARCLILPIRWAEPFGMVMIEAMSCGTPVVALARGSVTEVVRDRETGIICDDPAELPAALHSVTAIDPAACRQHVIQSFSAEVMAQRYERVYRAAVATTKSGRDPDGLTAVTT